MNILIFGPSGCVRWLGGGCMRPCGPNGLSHLKETGRKLERPRNAGSTIVSKKDKACQLEKKESLEGTISKKYNACQLEKKESLEGTISKKDKACQCEKKETKGRCF